VPLFAATAAHAARPADHPQAVDRALSHLQAPSRGAIAQADAIKAGDVIVDADGTGVRFARPSMACA
jgi:hypothetical protein